MVRKFMNKKFSSVLKRSVCLGLCACMALSFTGCKKKSGSVKEKTVFSRDEIVGQHIFFGNYDQNNDPEDGKESIEWIVLDQNGNKLLVIANSILDVTNYSSAETSDWESSELRTWLNDTFVKEAFSEDEQKSLIETKVSTPKNPVFEKETKKSKDTKDKVFIFSYAEAKKYFKENTDRVASGTYTVTKKGLEEKKGSANHSLYWALRTPGNDMSKICVVDYDGKISDIGAYFGEGYLYGVRPVMWIDANAVKTTDAE